MTVQEPRRAAVYLRRSSPSPTQEKSLESQINDIRRAAEEMSIEIDEGLIFSESITATGRKKRRALEAVLKAVREGEFRRRGVTMLLFWITDRFARNATEALSFEAELSRHGISVYSVVERYDVSSPSGRMEFMMRSMMAEMQNRLRAADLRRGQRYAIKQGKIMGIPPYGYRRTPTGQLGISIPHAAIVRRMFRLFLGGLSTRRIAGHLNEIGVPGPSGAKWINVTVIKILRSEAYTGIWVQGAGKNGSKREAALVEPHHHPAIVDLDTFIQAQRIFADRSKLRRYTATIRRFFLLGGMRLLRCRCGQPLRGLHYRNKKGREFFYYKCASGNAFGQRCGMPGIRCEVLDGLILQQLRSFIGTPAVVEWAWKLHQKEIAHQVFPLEEQLREVDQGLRTIDQRIQRLLAACEEGDAGGHLLATRLKDRRSERDALRIKRQSLMERIRETTRAMDQASLASELADFDKRYAALAPEGKKLLVSKFVELVEIIGPKSFRIKLRFMPKPLDILSDHQKTEVAR